MHVKGMRFCITFKTGQMSCAEAAPYIWEDAAAEEVINEAPAGCAECSSKEWAEIHLGYLGWSCKETALKFGTV